MLFLTNYVIVCVTQVLKNAVTISSLAEYLSVSLVKQSRVLDIVYTIFICP